MIEFENLLHKNNLRSTVPRQRLFMLLKNAKEPVSLNEIIKICPDFDRVTIYRIIETFIRIGITKVVHIGWKKRYELTDLFSPHHHHFRCTECHALSHISNEALEAAIDSMSRENGFLVTSHQFEIEGLCITCRALHKQHS